MAFFKGVMRILVALNFNGILPVGWVFFGKLLCFILRGFLFNGIKCFDYRNVRWSMVWLINDVFALIMFCNSFFSSHIVLQIEVLHFLFIRIKMNFLFLNHKKSLTNLYVSSVIQLGLGLMLRLGWTTFEKGFYELWTDVFGWIKNDIPRLSKLAKM